MVKYGSSTKSFACSFVSVKYATYPGNGIQHHQWDITSAEDTLINITYFWGQPYNLNPTVNISCLSLKGNLQVSWLVYFFVCRGIFIDNAPKVSTRSNLKLFFSFFSVSPCELMSNLSA